VITGLGVIETITILVLVLLFFGSKELPYFIKKVAQLIAKMRRYSDKVRREMNEITRSIEQPAASGVESPQKKKNALRLRHKQLRKEMSESEREEKSHALWERLFASDFYTRASAIMAYISTGEEVETMTAIRTMLKENKRIIVPYCKTITRQLGLAEIHSVDSDLTPGAYGIQEPIESLRDNFFRSDLQLIICPGVAFDTYGGRIGRGEGYYDSFLNEIKGNVTVVGLAFDCQITAEAIPFDYHDVAMDRVVTESSVYPNEET
jgi:5-formyltetrahydrofolate cyclo-ligase